MSSGESQRSPFAQYINKFTERKISGALVSAGYSLPCSVTAVMGSLVTVSFQIQTPGRSTTFTTVTMPVEGSEYARVPIQVGCQGWVKSATARLGGVTGQGAGTATLAKPTNLGALVFAPLGSSNFTPATDPNKYEIYGPEGFIARSQNGNVKIVGTETSLVLTVGSISMTITSSGIDLGNANLTTTGTITSNGIPLAIHLHTGVQTGGGDTGPPIS